MVVVGAGCGCGCGLWLGGGCELFADVGCRSVDVYSGHHGRGVEGDTSKEFWAISICGDL
jgi:hypothetical protein